MLARKVKHNWGVLLIWVGIVAGSAALYGFYGLKVMAPVLAIALAYLAIKPGAGFLGQLIARTPISIRWKTSGTIFLMLGILLGVSLVSIAMSESMHGDIHAIQELQDSAPLPVVIQINREAQGPESEILNELRSRFRQVPTALIRLEETQHSILTWTPWIVLGGGLIAVGLGAALSSSLIRPLRKMGEATRRIASGDYSQPVVVSNRDEVGELAQSLNSAAEDLSRLQEALLVEERARSLQERMAQASLAQEEERKRISRELHDGLGPSLADLGNRLSVCRQLVRVDSEKAESLLDEVTASLRGYIEEIRELINELRPLALDQLGLAAALRQYIQRYGEESGLQATLTVSGSLPSDPLTEVTIYRVVQESLNNVRRHAQATAVQVDLLGSDNIVEVVVSDDGQGFHPAKAVTSTVKGIGLESMRERAELAGGSFTVQSTPGQGCETLLRIPVRR